MTEKTEQLDTDSTISTQSPFGEAALTAVAEVPEVVAKFAEVFGQEEGEATQQVRSPARERQREAEAEEELEGLEGEELEDEKERLAEEKEEEENKDEDEEDDEGKGDTVGAAGKKKAASDEDKPLPLNPILHQAAKRSGLTDEAIKDFYESNPEMAQQAFRSLHAASNDLNTQYARLGQSTMQQREDQTTPQQQTSRTSQRPTPPKGGNGDLVKQVYSEEDIEILSEKYGKDFIAEVVQPLVETLVDPLNQMQDFIAEQEINANRLELRNYFKGLDKEYHEFYGDGVKQTDEQYEHKCKLATLADQIRAGARLQGLQFSVAESLDRANTLASTGHLEEIERKRLKGEVKKRSKQITNKPSQRKQAGADSDKKSIRGAVEAVTAKAAELGLDTT